MRNARILGAGLLLCLVCAAACSEEPEAPPHVVVFVLDATRADHVGAYGYARHTTPHIDAFARESTRFTQAIAEGSYTFASISALFTGRSPDQTGLLTARPLAPELELLPEAARSAGYRSYGYSENPHVSHAFGFDRGFDAFEVALSHAEWKRDTRGFTHSDSTPAIAEALAFASEPGPPFLLYLHLLRPHNPYAPPPPFAGRFGADATGPDGLTKWLLAVDQRRKQLSPARLDNTRALYDENLAAADAHFGALLDGLRSRGLLENSVVVLLSDHGEAFQEHGRLLHGSTTFEEMIRVPLLVRIPGDAGGGVADHPIQLATLGNRLRAVMAGDIHPKQLTEPSPGDAAETFSWTLRYERRASARTGARKLVLDTRTLELVGYYDLLNDPGETRSIPLDEEGERLRALLEPRIRAGVARARGEQPTAIDPVVREQIRALGYLEEDAD